MKTWRRMPIISLVAISLLAVSILLVPAATAAEEQAPTPTHQEMMDRSSKLMGFDMAKVNQHFYLTKNGGVVEITAKDPGDTGTIAAIQKHLGSEAKAWEKGNFDLPTQEHGKAPDGVFWMKKLRNEITFQAVPGDDGAVLRILTVNPKAKESVYEFIRFQINEHNTGDPLKLE